MNILFLHGLESNLSDDKRTVLEQYGDVFAPILDYKSNPDMIQRVYDLFHDQNIDAIIGSSMGGFTAFHLSKRIKAPALLFNPALPYRSVNQNIPETESTHEKLLQFVLGAKDDIVSSEENLKYIMNSVPRNHDIKIHSINNLEHRIPLQVFKDEVKAFFKSL
jgi:uncharacterized protein